MQVLASCTHPSVLAPPHAEQTVGGREYRRLGWVRDRSVIHTPQSSRVVIPVQHFAGRIFYTAYLSIPVLLHVVCPKHGNERLRRAGVVVSMFRTLDFIPVLPVESLASGVSFSTAKNGGGQAHTDGHHEGFADGYKSHYILSRAPLEVGPLSLPLFPSLRTCASGVKRKLGPSG